MTYIVTRMGANAWSDGEWVVCPNEEGYVNSREAELDSEEQAIERARRLNEDLIERRTVKVFDHDLSRQGGAGSHRFA
jgi:hypothetical protein